MELIKGNVRVEWDSIGEGFNGDYNPDNPDDKELLRFYISKRDNGTGNWEDVADASYCTCFSADADDKMKMRALEIIMDRVYDYVISDISIKKICEELSYLSEAHFERDRNPLLREYFDKSSNQKNPKPKASIEDRLRAAQEKVDAQAGNQAPGKHDKHRSGPVAE